MRRGDRGGGAADAFAMRYSNPEEPRVALSDDRALLKVEADRVPTGDGVEIRYLMDPRLFGATREDA